MATFPHVRRRSLGYRVDEVEEFLQLARSAYDADRGGQAPVTSESIRLTAFSMARGGYAPAAVDAAMERLEDAFAARERETAVRQQGDKAWYSGTRVLAKEIIARLSRPEKHRFSHTGLLSVGYRPRDVDRFMERVRLYFEEGTELSVEEVRGVAFRSSRHGYREAQVDLVIDGVIEVILAVR
jgi:DivIVA domain-containing protein